MNSAKYTVQNILHFSVWLQLFLLSPFLKWYFLFDCIHFFVAIVLNSSYLFDPHSAIPIFSYISANGLTCYSCNSRDSATCAWGIASFTYNTETCASAGIIDSLISLKCYKITAESKYPISLFSNIAQNYVYYILKHFRSLRPIVK